MSNPYKQRFKGVENFLRRVAFNLGNTPSQTEVKIISCIPIDVTDLQHKIQQLERQLQDLSKRKDAPQLPSPAASPKPLPEPKKIEKPEKPLENAEATDKNQTIGDKANTPANKGATVVNTALFGESFSGHTTTVSYCSDGSLRDNRSRNMPTSGNFTSRQRKSNDSFVLSEMSKCRHEQPSYDFRSRDNVDPDKIENVDLDKIDTNLAAAERFYMNLFRKRKKKRVCKGKSKVKTHLVYFAQHDQSNPFNTNDTLDHFDTLNSNTVSLSHAYLDNVMRKQYDPQYVVQEFSDTSHFSRPICRDTNKNFTYSRHESDVCSCCHGQFQNIDDYMPKGFESINRMTKHERNYTTRNKSYYDSNFYDVVPVRENTINFVKESVLPKRDIDMRCWPEQFRSKYRYGPKTVTYQAERPIKRWDKLIAQKIKHKKIPDQYTAEQKRLKIQQTIKETSESSSIETDACHKTMSKIKKIEPVKTVLLKNELTKTDDTNTKVLVKNQSTQLELIPDENKTKSTLDQIKSILQSVLTEVKTHPKVNSTFEKPPQKDAVVQKEMSQNNMLGQSTLLNSFTYSYNTNPYLPSCSRQALIGPNGMAGAPYQPSLKYLQNFPVFVHPSGRHFCACYYKKSSHKCSKCKHASMAATNTDREIQSDGKKETEKLIKEIYKSMALSMDFPTKENSVSEYDELKSTENVHISDNKVKNVRSASVEVVDKRDIEVEALISSDISTQSEETVRTIEALHYNDSTKNQANHDRILYRLEQHSNGTILEDDEDTNPVVDDDEDAEETEDDDVDIKEYETPAKIKRKGLLQRMLGSVKMFKKKKSEPNHQNDYEVEVSEASDTEDYETIYSGITVVLPPKNRRQNHKRKTEIQGNTAEENQFMRVHEKGRRSPYLEQEYKRQWHEQMMLAKQQEKKYSSERPFSKRTPPNDDTPVYWNNYEARSAIVEHNLPNRLKCVDSKTKLTTNLKRDSLDTTIDGGAKDKLRWAKKYKPNCGEQWKKFLLDN